MKVESCGISFGNAFQTVAKGDTFIFHFPLSIFNWLCRLPDKWQFDIFFYI